MSVSRKQAMEMFDHDLGFFMNDLRGLLARYQISDWESYVFFRKPEYPESYVLKYESVSGDKFARKIVELHAKEFTNAD